MRILCSAKDSHIFSTKNDSVFVILMFEILTKRLLTTSLVLNNWPQDPVVQSIVSLTISLRHKFVKQISAKVTNTLLFFVEKM